MNSILTIACLTVGVVAAGGWAVYAATSTDDEATVAHRLDLMAKADESLKKIEAKSIAMGKRIEALEARVVPTLESRAPRSTKAFEARVLAKLDEQIDERVRAQIDERVTEAVREQIKALPTVPMGPNGAGSPAFLADASPMKVLPLSEIARELGLTSQEENQLRELEEDLASKALELFVDEGESVASFKERIATAQGDRTKTEALQASVVSKMVTNIPKVFQLKQQRSRKGEELLGKDRWNKYDNGYQPSDIDVGGLDKLMSFGE